MWPVCREKNTARYAVFVVTVRHIAFDVDYGFVGTVMFVFDETSVAIGAILVAPSSTQRAASVRRTASVATHDYDWLLMVGFSPLRTHAHSDDSVA